MIRRSILGTAFALALTLGALDAALAQSTSLAACRHRGVGA